MEFFSITKSPGADLDYGFDWSSWLQVGETISSSSWAVPSGLILDKHQYSDTGTVAWLSGGTLWTSYEAVNTIVTSEGRTEDRTLLIQVIPR